MLPGSIYDVRHVTDLKDMIRQSSSLFGSRDAFRVSDGEGCYRGIRYSEFEKDMNALGTALISLGLKDKFIAVIGENRYEWCLTYLSVVNGTGIVVPLDKELPPAEIENLLVRSNAEAVVFSGKLSAHMKKLSASLPSVKYFISMDLAEDDGCFISFKGLVAKGMDLVNSGSRLFTDAQVDPNVMSILLFTSGTTDMAKGVMLSHKNICFDITSVCSVVYLDSNDSVLSILPLHHTYECSLGFLGILYNGGTIYFNEGLKHIAKNLKQSKPTILFVVPLLLENMYRKIWDQAGKTRGLKTKLRLAMLVSSLLYNVFGIDIRKKLFKQIHENMGGNLRLVLTGAAAIDPKVSKGLRKMGIPVLQGYGLTECSPLVTGNRDKDYRDKSIGLPIPGVEVKITGADADGIGELITRGDNVMLGYFNNDAATRGCIRDGWFYTGDIGYMDKSGYYYITGRKKNVIVTKNGKNIFPEEVESYINKSPYVQESLVVGKYDNSSGETHVIAQIVPNFEEIQKKLKVVELKKDEILNLIGDVIKSVNKEMPLYKRIQDFTIRDNEFVKTTTQKIKRYVENANGIKNHH